MQIIEITPLLNGAHRNQSGDMACIPEGWAVIPPAVVIPNTFPFVDVEAANGVVTKLTEKSVPDPAPAPAPAPTPEERITALESATAITFVTLCEAGNIDVVTASEHVDLFSPWAYPVSYKTGQILEHGGKLYKCLQDHTSQETWTPDAAPSLWVAISDPAEEWPEWSQPVGSTDAYAKGAKVSHSGKHWTSDVDNNVWEPGVYGWTEVTEA